MPKGEPPPLRPGISACLLGEPVRYDGGHKRDAFLTDTLGPFVQWVPVCPEVEIGLGVPRPAIRLVGEARAPRLVVDTTGEDLTVRMRRFARSRARELATLGLDGYVLKRASPSCGLLRVGVHPKTGGAPRAGGRGLFAAALVERLPLVPVEEEGRLADAAIREHFIERVFAASRWRAFAASRPGARDLVAFHGAQKLTVLAHSPAHYARLVRLVATAGRADAMGRRLQEYGRLLMEALAIPATRGRHANVPQHVAGVFTTDLSPDERAELAGLIDDYRRARVPLVVPLTLVTHHARRLGVAYPADQVYLSPDPRERRLRHHV